MSKRTIEIIFYERHENGKLDTRGKERVIYNAFVNQGYTPEKMVSEFDGPNGAVKCTYQFKNQRETPDGGQVRLMLQSLSEFGGLVNEIEVSGSGNRFKIDSYAVQK